MLPAFRDCLNITLHKSLSKFFAKNFILASIAKNCARYDIIAKGSPPLEMLLVRPIWRAGNNIIWNFNIFTARHSTPLA